MDSRSRCISCEESLRPVANFCVQCGTAVSEPTNVASDTSNDVVLVRGFGRPGPGSAGGAAPAIRKWASRFVVASAGILVGLVARSIFAPTVEPVSDLGQLLLLGDRRVPPGWADLPLDETAEITLRVDSDRAGFPPPTERDEVDVEFEPIPELARFELLVANAAVLVRVDLATLSQVSAELTGQPLARYNDQLVLYVPGNGMVSALLSDLSDASVLVGSEPGLNFSGLSVDEDGLLAVAYFVYEDGVGQVEKSRTTFIDLNDGRTRSVVDDASLWNVDPRISWTAGVGTYERHPDGTYRTLSEGIPVATGGTVVLVLDCATPTSCQQFWIDRETGQRLDRHVPDGFVNWLRVIGPSGRFVFVEDPEPGYFDTETGKALPFQATGFDNHSGPFPHVGETTTHDGRFLIVPDGGDVVVYDSETGQASRISLELPGHVAWIDLVPTERG